MAMKKGGFSSARRAFDVAEGLGLSVVLVALVAAVVFAATRPAVRVRLDLTEGATYTLTDQTKQVLANLDESVEFVSIMRPEPSPYPTGLQAVQLEAADYVHAMLHEYELASGGRVGVRVLDPTADRLEVSDLMREMHLARANVVLVRGPQRTEQVFLEDLVTIDQGTADLQDIRPAEIVDLRAEGPLTSALLSVSSEVAPRVGFLTAMAGPALDDFESGGLGLLQTAVRLQGLEPQGFELVTGATVPPELDVVAVVGPANRLTPAMVDALRAFHRDGGALLLALDPESPPRDVSDEAMDELLAELGFARGRFILVRDDVIADGATRAVLPVRDFGEHEIVSSIAAQGVFATFPATGQIARHPNAPAGLVVDMLAQTDPLVFADQPASAESSYGNFELDPGEVRGARWIAAARDGLGPTGRVALFGNSRFMTNDAIERGGSANLSLALNTLQWLAGREDAIAVRPRTRFESRVELYADEQAEIFTYVVVVMPLAGALLGLLVWFTRRR